MPDFDTLIAGAIVNGRKRRITTLREIAENSLGSISDSFWARISAQWEFHAAMPDEELLRKSKEP